MSWLQFIEQGFTKKEEQKGAEQYFEQYGAMQKPSDSGLHIYYYVKDGIKYFTVCCDCGNRYMTVHELGIRCQICGKFHTHDNFQKMRLKARKEANNLKSQVQKIPQPYVYYRFIQKARRAFARRGTEEDITMVGRCA